MTSKEHQIKHVRKGVEFVNSFTGEYDFVIVDQINKFGMDGDVAFGKVKSLFPEVKGIIMSGYSENQIVSNYKYHGFIGRIEKPFTFEKLTEVIEKIS